MEDSCDSEESHIPAASLASTSSPFSLGWEPSLPSPEDGVVTSPEVVTLQGDAAPSTDTSLPRPLLMLPHL